MKKRTLVIALLMAVASISFGQKSASQPRSLKEVMTLKVSRPGGANGANVAWHPVQKKYYAAMAGNVEYAMDIFDVKGTIAEKTDVETMFDVRGLWYNPKTKALQTNGYNDFGWAEYRLDERGYPYKASKLSIVASQPAVQSVGAFDPAGNTVYFFDFATLNLEGHPMKSDAGVSTKKLHLRAMSEKDLPAISEDDIKDDYNENAIVFTGIKQAEIGLLNATGKQIELYDRSTGYMKQVLQLPADAPAEHSLNFSHSNGIYWLFNKVTRVWHGYK